MSLFRPHPLLTTFLQLEVGSICFSQNHQKAWRASLYKSIYPFVKNLPPSARGRFLDSAFRTIDNQIYWLDLRGSQECYLYNSHTHEIILPSYKIPITHFRRCRALRNESLRGIPGRLFAPGLETIAPPQVYPLDEDPWMPEYSPPTSSLSTISSCKTLEEKISDFLSPSNDKNEFMHLGNFTQEFCDEMEQKYPTLAFILHPTHIQVL